MKTLVETKVLGINAPIDVQYLDPDTEKESCCTFDRLDSIEYDSVINYLSIRGFRKRIFKEDAVDVLLFIKPEYIRYILVNTKSKLGLPKALSDILGKITYQIHKAGHIAPMINTWSKKFGASQVTFRWEEFAGEVPIYENQIAKPDPEEDEIYRGI